MADDKTIYSELGARSAEQSASDAKNKRVFKASLPGYDGHGIPYKSDYAEVKLNEDGTVVVGEITKKENTSINSSKNQNMSRFFRNQDNQTSSGVDIQHRPLPEIPADRMQKNEDEPLYKNSQTIENNSHAKVNKPTGKNTVVKTGRDAENGQNKAHIHANLTDLKIEQDEVGPTVPPRTSSLQTEPFYQNSEELKTSDLYTKVDRSLQKAVNSDSALDVKDAQNPNPIYQNFSENAAPPIPQHQAPEPPERTSSNKQQPNENKSLFGKIIDAIVNLVKDVLGAIGLNFDSKEKEFGSMESPEKGSVLTNKPQNQKSCDIGLNISRTQANTPLDRQQSQNLVIGELKLNLEQQLKPIAQGIKDQMKEENKMDSDNTQSPHTPATQQQGSQMPQR